jgi:alpha-ketoglutarate-dependent taurine dioxygenase
LRPSTLLPLVIQPAAAKVSLNSWVIERREFLETSLLKHGAILFRNFGMSTVAEFEEFARIASNEVMDYRERSSPRHEVGTKVYTSTDYPASESIFPHNEHSYSETIPMRLFFFCATPARRGGETPITDCRKIYQRISPEIRERFEEKNWMYVRNFGERFGLPWQTVFQTTDPGVVEKYCRKHSIEFQWKNGGQLRTRQIRPAVAHHPRTGENVWFNHLTFFHVSTLTPVIRNMLLASFKEEDLPNNTYYGDGSPIEPEVLDELRQAYLQELEIFSWQQGDILMLDNMLVAHSRKPFSGPRKILFAMADPYTRRDL